jgi:hypothetical protein
MNAVMMHQNGKPINGGQTTTEGKSKISLNAVVVRNPLTSGIYDAIIKDLSNHLALWSASIPEASFQINTIGDLIYLDTNSVELLDLYKQYEEPYVAYLVEIDALIVDEMYWSE